jgi:hypothetical protein
MFNTGTIRSTLLSDCMFHKNWPSETHSLIKVIPGIFVGIFRNIFPLQVQSVENNLNKILV